MLVCNFPRPPYSIDLLDINFHFTRSYKDRDQRRIFLWKIVYTVSPFSDYDELLAFNFSYNY